MAKEYEKKEYELFAAFISVEIMTSRQLSLYTQPTTYVIFATPTTDILIYIVSSIYHNPI